MPEEQAQRNLSAPDMEPDGSGTREYYDKSWAVVIGINDYGERHRKLDNAANDAKEFCQLLRQKFGFDEDKVFFLQDDKASQKEIRNLLLDTLPSKVGLNDRFIFFFAGHGDSQPTKHGYMCGYLVPQDARQNMISDYLDMDELLRACDRISAKHILLILDCCFSGIVAVAPPRRGESKAPQRIDDEYLRKITERTAWQVLTAGDKDELVIDSGSRQNHSAFTSALLDALDGEEADTDKNYIITTSELYSYIKSRVIADTSREGRKGQVPFFNYLNGSGAGDFVFLLPGYGKTDKSTRAERAKKIRAILQDLSSNDVLPDSIIQKAERIIATKSEGLSKEDQSFDNLLDQLLKGDLKSKQFVSEWFRLAAKEEEWGGCISWDGDERSLPISGQIRVPGLRIDKLVKKYVIVDTESENGFKEIKLEELLPGMAIIDAIINERLFNQLVLSWGKKAVMINPSDGGKSLDRWEWKERFDTDGLKLWIIQDALRASQEAGVLKNQAAPMIDISQSKIEAGDADLSADSSEQKLEPGLASEWFEKGAALADKGQYDKAIKAYDRAIVIDPNFAWPWNNKGVALYNKGKYDEAIKAYDKAIEIDPKYTDAWNNKGLALYNKGKYDEAIKAYDKAIETDPNYAYAWNNKGSALKALKRTKEAKAAFARAKELGYKG